METAPFRAVVARVLPSIAVAGVAATVALTQQHMRSVPGPAAGVRFGASLLRAGDLNGDQYEDLLVGAPGTNNDRGKVYALSGAHLATGSGPSTLWGVTAPTALFGDQFGHALASLGDVNGDGVQDFLVSGPYADVATVWDGGAVWVIDGATHAPGPSIVSPSPATKGLFGYAMDAYGDRDGDGHADVVVGEPTEFSGSWTSGGAIYLLSGAHLVNNGSAHVLDAYSFGALSPIQNLGWSVASGFDVNGDGDNEILVGAPGSNFERGSVFLYFAAGTGMNATLYSSQLYPPERLGWVVDGGFDYDGDGLLDVVAGAPLNASHATSAGRALALSGAGFLTGSGNQEIHVFPSYTAGAQWGMAVCASPDLSGDGIGDVLVGTSQYASFPNGAANGLVNILSGDTGAFIEPVAGANNDRLGEVLLGAVQDYDADGWPEYVVAGPYSDAGGVDSGVIKCYRFFPAPVSSYCTAKVNSLGCTPVIGWAGSPSATSAASFQVRATNVISQKSGILFYGYAPGAVTFQGGFLCVMQPFLRTPVQSSRGSASGVDCSGAYAFEMNAHIQSGIDPTLGVGAEVFCQYWSRDPQSPSTTGLTNAARFLVNL